MLFDSVDNQIDDELMESLPSDLQLRIHRGASWFNRAEKITDDDDAAFIFYWVAFNSLYGYQVNNLSETDSERKAFEVYFNRISHLDCENRVYNELWHRFSDPVRNLVENKFVYQPFWNHYNNIPGNDDWEERFENAKQLNLIALKTKDINKILSIIFDRLYVLRNQVFHGAATYQSSVNRAPVRDAKNILAFLLPIFIELMVKNPQAKWGAPCYPVVD